MDYEQKYKNILDDARYWHDVSEGDIPAVLEEIFPELAESEDERIRKRIIQAIKIREKEMNEEWSDEIAWIEKQGQSHWSEEDEKLWQSIIDDSMKENQLDNEQINWFISIKNRIKGE